MLFHWISVSDGKAMYLCLIINQGNASVSVNTLVIMFTPTHRCTRYTDVSDASVCWGEYTYLCVQHLFSSLTWGLNIDMLLAGRLHCPVFAELIKTSTIFKI